MSAPLIHAAIQDGEGLVIPCGAGKRARVSSPDAVTCVPCLRELLWLARVRQPPAAPASQKAPTPEQLATLAALGAEVSDACETDEQHRLVAQVLEDELEHLESRTATVKAALSHNRRKQSAERAQAGEGLTKIRDLLVTLKGLDLGPVGDFPITGWCLRTMGEHGPKEWELCDSSDEELRSPLADVVAIIWPRPSAQS